MTRSAASRPHSSRVSMPEGEKPGDGEPADEQPEGESEKDGEAAAGTSSSQPDNASDSDSVQSGDTPSPPACKICFQGPEQVTVSSAPSLGRATRESCCHWPVTSLPG